MTRNIVVHEKHAGREAQPGTLKNQLRLLSYNIQVAVASTRLRHYVTQGWKHFLPHPQSLTNLDRIAEITRNFDVVALQEVDAGSLRSSFVNQVEYLAEKSHFPFWYYQTNRNLGKFAQASNGLLSHIRPSEIVEHKLPGLIPGRGAIFVRYGNKDNPLVLLLVHLALGKRARLAQLDFVADVANHYQHVVLMGDLNCQPNSHEMRFLLRKTALTLPSLAGHTFPSWRPARTLDYILTTPSLTVQDAHVLNYAISDHLPVAVNIQLPADFELNSS
jgi:endonuclease/exonuclease/phosphatase family metal-dependent hydrolase